MGFQPFKPSYVSRCNAVMLRTQFVSWIWHNILSFFFFGSNLQILPQILVSRLLASSTVI
jgi:hypothetical protein